MKRKVVVARPRESRAKGVEHVVVDGHVFRAVVARLRASRLVPCLGAAFVIMGSARRPKHLAAAFLACWTCLLLKKDQSVPLLRVLGLPPACVSTPS